MPNRCITGGSAFDLDGWLRSAPGVHRVQLLVVLFCLSFALGSIAQTPPAFQFAARGGGVSQDISSGIAVDALGNIYVTGTFSNTATFGSSNLTSAGNSDVFMAKYTPRGILSWLKRAGAAGADRGTHVTVDAQGSIIFSGTLVSPASFDGVPYTSSGGYLAKYDAGGQLTWVKPSSAPTRIASDSTGNIYLVGPFSNLFLEKYDANGDLTYRQQAITTPFSASLTNYSTGNGVAVDQDTNVFVVGTFFGDVRLTNTVSGTPIMVQAQRAGQTWVTPNTILVRYRSDGKAAWAVGLGGCSECVNDRAIDVAADEMGDAYIIGVLFNRPYLAKYNFLGTNLWTTNALGQEVDDVAVFRKANILVTGKYFSINSGPVHLNTVGGSDAYVLRFDPAGQIKDGFSVGGPANETGYGLAVDAAGNICFSGVFENNAMFGTNSLTSAGGQDVFVTKTQTTLAALNIAITNGELRVSWSALAEGYVLEGTDSLNNPFSSTGLTPQVQGSEASVTLPPGGNRFFRLRRP